MRIKTYRKSSAFWKHGKHSSILWYVRRKERETVKHTSEMYSTIKEAFASAIKNRKEPS